MSGYVSYIDWINKEFDFTESGFVRVLESRGEFIVILLFKERELDNKKMYDDLWSIYTSSLLYDPNLHIDCFYIVHKITQRLSNLVAHVYTADLYNYKHYLITYDELVHKTIYLEVG